MAESPAASTEVVEYGKPDDPTWQELVDKMETGGVALALDEYKELKKAKPAGRTAEHFAKWKTRNRYQDVACWDQTRVPVLKGPVNYIHANYVHGYNKPRQFIATQGPIEDVAGQFECTIPEFWRMVWEQNVRVIVMLCQTVETGKAKCSQYWPEKVGEKMVYGDLVLETREMGQRDIRDHNIILSTMTISEKGSGKKPRQVAHFLHLNWPDRKCPPSAYPIVDFLYRVHAAQKRLCDKSKSPVDKSPVVVHCSAGIGRSGTFIAIDIGLDLINATGRVNVMELVRLIRTQRNFAVQTPVQYVCLYQALLEFLVKKHGAKIGMAKFERDAAAVK